MVYQFLVGHMRDCHCKVDTETRNLRYWLQTQWRMHTALLIRHIEAHLFEPGVSDSA